MSQAIDSGGAAVEKKSQKKRNKTIENATNDLDDKKITIIEFLSRVTCKTEHGIMNMDNFEVSPGYTSDSSDDDDDEDEHGIEKTNNCITDFADNLCIICCERKKNVIFLPCRHQKCCEECSSELAARAHDRIECPCCKQTVMDTIVAFI